MTANSPSSAKLKSLLSTEFSAVGLKAAEVWKTLPDWWRDAIAYPSGVHEIRGFVAKHFGLQIDRAGQLQQRPMPAACFKTRGGTDPAKIASPRALATAVAHIVAQATPQPWIGALPSVSELRGACLQRKDSPWVGLPDLLEACWSSGVPVIYLPALPTAEKKMDGMVTTCAGRPVIIITKKYDLPAWILFILAHEMGHVALGHLNIDDDGDTIVDEKVSEDDVESSDAQEQAANRYALQLLTGNENSKLNLKHLMGARELAAIADRYGRQYGISPGHVVLNAVRHTKKNGKSLWPLGNETLKFLASEREDTSALCQKALRAHLDAGVLSDDSFEFLERLGVL
ncbi:ImmA/IrrE family metallo-endopeptidase [Azospirillum cavernae]|uniref:ImmA/IrrE family metallo-endopeptidase n=1 Tax=Azospirillum cavernae TaxID=2320860 RepID=A0A418VX46_9PROT|nr:ImmA/IrrE family metallo-endopeptidase [Azospirillum cavernae]RJF81722.1 ImmA/IrrE family metallo-endopeptidase [Azospirillum cavernae]